VFNALLPPHSAGSAGGGALGGSGRVDAGGGLVTVTWALPPGVDVAAPALPEPVELPEPPVACDPPDDEPLVLAPPEAPPEDRAPEAVDPPSPGSVPPFAAPLPDSSVSALDAASPFLELDELDGEELEQPTPASSKAHSAPHPTNARVRRAGTRHRWERRRSMRQKGIPVRRAFPAALSKAGRTGHPRVGRAAPA
jgi:hypothetical protein